MVSSVVPVFKNVEERSTAKNNALLVFFLWLVKSLKNLEVTRLLITKRNVIFFLISSLGLGLVDQLQIFSRLYLIELLGLLTGLRLLGLWHCWST